VSDEPENRLISCQPEGIVDVGMLEVVCVTDAVCVIVTSRDWVTVICCMEVTTLVTVTFCVVVCGFEKMAHPAPTPMAAPISSKSRDSGRIFHCSVPSSLGASTMLVRG
jgi:hypothetical protein